MDYKIVRIEKHIDKRGDLVVFLRHSELGVDKKTFGQIYFITFSRKGVVRGNHYHKQWREWFGIVTGKVAVELEDVITKEHVCLELDARHSDYTRLEIGPNIAHAFKSISSSVSLLNYADKEWSAQDNHHYLLQHRKVYNNLPKPPPDLLRKSKRLGLRKSPKAIFLINDEK